MSSPLPALLALLTGIAGWFYLFFSKAAHGLAGIEEDRLNRRRVRLRRAGGAVMLLLAVGFYLGFYAADPQARPRLFVGVWLGVMLLLAAIVLLALADVGLTVRLRRRRRERQRVQSPDGPGPNEPGAASRATDHRGPDRDRPPPP